MILYPRVVRDVRYTVYWFSFDIKKICGRDKPGGGSEYRATSAATLAGTGRVAHAVERCGSRSRAHR